MATLCPDSLYSGVCAAKRRVLDMREIQPGVSCITEHDDFPAVCLNMHVPQTPHFQ